MLVFASGRQEAPGMYQKLAGGGQPEALLLRSEAAPRDEHWPSDWSSKGIVYASGRNRESDDLWMLPLKGDPYPLVREPGQQDEARVSPDAQWLAYTDFANGGRPDVFVQSLTTTGAKWRISSAGGRLPRWRRDGKELFYLAADGNLTSVPIQPDATTFRQGVTQRLFQTGHSVVGGAGLSAFNVSPDGERFLLTTAADQERSASIVVVTNWQSALKP
jgi:Tol biopolymer transport system component